MVINKLRASRGYTLAITVIIMSFMLLSASFITSVAIRERSYDGSLSDKRELISSLESITRDFADNRTIDNGYNSLTVTVEDDKLTVYTNADTDTVIFEAIVREGKIISKRFYL